MTIEHKKKIYERLRWIDTIAVGHMKEDCPEARELCSYTREIRKIIDAEAETPSYCGKACEVES
jgi:hypothetical protein